MKRETRIVNRIATAVRHRHNRLLQDYAGEDIYRRERTASLSLLNLLLVILAGFGAAIAAARAAEMAAAELVGADVRAVAVLLLAAMLGWCLSSLLLYRGHDKAAINITLYTAGVGVLAAAALLFVLSEAAPDRVLMLPVIGMLLVQLLVLLVGYALYQILLAGAVAVLLAVPIILFHLQVRAAGADPAAGTGTAALLLLGVGVPGVSTLLSGLMFRAVRRYVHGFAEQLGAARKQQQHLREVMETSREAAQIGGKLTDIAGETGAVVEDMGTRIADMRARIMHQYENLVKLRDANTNVSDAAEQFNTILEDQHQEISQSSSSIEQMTASIQAVTGIANERRESFSSLTDRSKSSQEGLERAQGAIARVQRNSAAIGEVVKVIDDISSRTNLLAMNAAIEAAHAGDAGRGFAVVAAEIRKLAENTSENTGKIRDTIARNANDIEVAVKVNREAGAVITDVNHEIQDFVAAMGEISRRLSEVAGGTAEVLSSVEQLTGKSETGREASGQVQAHIALASFEVMNVESLFEQLKETIQELDTAFESIRSTAGALEQLGQSNIEHMQSLNAQLSSGESASE